ncbi:hypothetical protein IIC65_06335 [Candidatus Sumerlaeota bacterium]|nr:hypothetical protein [Candidatus Sumerlaeota bacterium]
MQRLAVLVSVVSIFFWGTRVNAENLAAEASAKKAIETFMTAWNTGEDSNLRKTMNFPFVSFGGGAVRVAAEPEDFSQGFDRMREREGWARSTFDFDTYEVFLSSAEKVHCRIDFARYKSDGARYLTGTVMYIVTKRDGHWGVQLRTSGGSAQGLGAAQRAEAIRGARQAALDFMAAFNAGDTDATTRPLNYPHLFMTMGGGFTVAEDASHGSVRPNFERMRERENWHVSTFDSIEASIVTPNKVHLEITFSRWHPDGTRYWTIPALWVATRVGDHWGIQLRSLMPATFDQRGN